MLPFLKRFIMSGSIVAIYWYFAYMITYANTPPASSIVETLFVFTISKFVISMTLCMGGVELYALVMRLRYRGGRSREQMSKFFFG